MKEGMIAEVVGFPAHDGDTIEGYLARPSGQAAVGGVVVIHHAPGWDPWIKELTRRFAAEGFAALAPHLYHRWGSGPWDAVAAEARSHGIAKAMPDDQVMGDVSGSATHLRLQPWCNGKVGVIGFCSGGRQAYLAACTIPDLDAAVDCWGGNVVAQPNPSRPDLPPSVIQHTAAMQMPLLGIFGNEDANPAPAQVDETEAELKRLGKEYEFHRYDGAGHGFLATDRAGYRPEQAVDAWSKIVAFFGGKLGGADV